MKQAGIFRELIFISVLFPIGFILGFAFENLKEIPRLKQPTFTFAHMLAPHPPIYLTVMGIK